MWNAAMPDAVRPATCRCTRQGRAERIHSLRHRGKRVALVDATALGAAMALPICGLCADGGTGCAVAAELRRPARGLPATNTGELAG
jgi:hypothetical protein